MKYAGPIIFCFALACTVASMLSEAHRLAFFLIGCGVVGLSSLVFVIYSFSLGHRHPLLLFLLCIAVLSLLFTPY